MNTFDDSQGFFSKPAFRQPPQPAVLKGSARRALAAFDTGYQFSCTFFPAGMPRLKSPATQPALETTPALDRASSGEDRLATTEIDRLLARNLLPRFEDNASSPRRPVGFSPEAIELGALLVIIGAVLTKLYLG